MRLGVDTGGTFTDFVLVDESGAMRVHKVPSTPAAPEEAILEGVRALGLDASALRVVHGSTVATNAVLEGKGARTVFITSHGFGDTLTIGRQARPRLYDLQPPAIPPPVPANLCLECGGRVTSGGETLEPLSDDDIHTVCARVEALAPEAVAISLLFSFVDGTHERRLAEALPPAMFVSCSSEVLPEYREYERGIATWLNARVGPVMAGYLGRLSQALPAVRIGVMQSSGGTVDASQAGRKAVHLLLSGPAGGVLGAAALGRHVGNSELLTFDMGGTSTDVALIAGRPALTGEGRIAGYPIAVPMVDIHTIGAGGGSIAWVDEGGVLQVGPRSAGADPGPACYGLAGDQPTVTDAHAVLGHLPAIIPLGGRLVLDVAAARTAVSALAGRLGLDCEETARGILRLADEHMAQALRVISVERGEDPRDYTLMPFGGAGGLHVCALAERLDMRRAIVPVHAGVLSALGMLVARAGRVLSRTLLHALDTLPVANLETCLSELEAQARAELSAEGVHLATLETTRSVDLRYCGQSHVLELGWEGDVIGVAEAFHALHEHRYGHRLDLPVELVNARARVEAPPPELRLPERPRGTAAEPLAFQAVFGVDEKVPVFAAESLGAGTRLAGPAIVSSADATLWLAPGWNAEADCYGNLTLAR